MSLNIARHVYDDYGLIAYYSRPGISRVALHLRGGPVCRGGTERRVKEKLPGDRTDSKEILISIIIYLNSFLTLSTECEIKVPLSTGRCAREVQMIQNYCIRANVTCFKSISDMCIIYPQIYLKFIISKFIQNIFRVLHIYIFQWLTWD